MYIVYKEYPEAIIFGFCKVLSKFCNNLQFTDATSGKATMSGCITIDCNFMLKDF